MIRSGLVSITFRKLSPERVIALAREASLEGIEWGGDIHVPHGDTDTARRVGRHTRDAGLEVAAYGSYYFIGHSEEHGLDFSDVLETAAALGAPTIRTWAGKKGTDVADEAHWSRVVEDAQRIAEASRNAGVRICIEYHGNSLTDHCEAAISLHRGIASDNVDMLWQPSFNHSFEAQHGALASLMPMLSNVHVYWWPQADNPHGFERKPLADGLEAWQSFASLLNQSQKDRFAMLEYVKDDNVEQFHQDARVLNNLLAG